MHVIFRLCWCSYRKFYFKKFSACSACWLSRGGELPSGPDTEQILDLLCCNVYAESLLQYRQLLRSR